MTPGRLYLHLRKALSYRVDYLKAVLHWRRIRFSESPILFGNAMAKSGSNLLKQIFHGFHHIGPFAPVKRWPIRMITQFGRVRQPEEVQRDLAGLRPGDLALGYVHAEPAYLELMTQAGWTTFFLLRDPRDVLVSHVHYATDMNPDHSLHGMYQSLDDFDERLTVGIRGTDGYPYLPDVRRRYEHFLGFLDRPEIMVVRFEDLRTNPEATVAAMIDRIRERSEVSLLPTEVAVPIVLDRIEPSKSPTFRSGAPGAWREHFKEHHKDLFREVAGDLLQTLGYENSDDW